MRRTDPKNPLKRIRKNDIPASVGLVKEVRSELIAKVSSVEKRLLSEVHQVRAEVHQVRAEVHQVKAEVHQLKSEVQQVKSEVQQVKSEVQQVLSEVHGIKVLVEEQRSDNRIVLDGIKILMDRQTRLEAEFEARG